MKSILVTGCAGFIGSHITKKYIDEGSDVVGIDDFTSSSKTSKHFLALKNDIQFHDGDICDKNFIYRALYGKKFDIVYNFACPASPPIYQKFPIKTLLTCTQGFNNIIEVTSNSNPKTIIVQASTSEVYGDPETNPQTENQKGNVNCYGIRSNYDEGKRAAEALAYDYLNSKNIDVRLVRIFNTYGPNMDKNDGRVVTNFVNQILNNKDITIYGTGLQTRSFCYVDDLLKGIVALANLKTNPKSPVNIGNPFEFTMLELASKIVRMVPETTSKIIYKPLPGDDPRQRQPDITLAKNILNWVPETSLDKGLEKMINWAVNDGWRTI